MIKAVVFDLGGVLVNSPEQDPKIYKKDIKVQEEILALALQLKSRGLKIGILSNTIPEHVEILTQLGFFPHFDDKIFSYEVNLRKPDPRIYSHSTENLGVTPSEIIYIDDKLEYVQAASAFGMHGVLYENETQLASDIEKLLSA